MGIPGPLGLIFGAFAALPVALVICLGVLAGRRFELRAAYTGGAILALAFIPMATALALAQWPRDHRPAHPVPIELAMGSYAGVTLGDSERDALRHAKEPLVGRGVRQLWKSGGEQSDPFGYSSASDALIYRDHALLLLDGTVVAIVITNPDAETAKGIGPGDGLALVPQRYPMLHCEAHDIVGEDGPQGPPDCHGHVGNVGLWTSGDPVELITIASVDAGMRLGLPR